MHRQKRHHSLKQPVFASKEQRRTLPGPEQALALSNAALPLPTAADVQAFLWQALEGAAGEWLSHVMPFCRNMPALSGNILELHFDKMHENIDFATRLNTIYDTALMVGFRQRDYILPFIPEDLSSLIHQNVSAFNYGIENIWVEYDAPFINPPALFFDINKNKPFHPEDVYGGLQEVAYILDCSINKAVLDFLKKLAQDKLWVVYYGLMFSRKQPSVRLTIHGIGAENILDAFRCLGWKGNYEALKKFRSQCLHKEQKLVIGVDVVTQLETRIGIEVFDEGQYPFIQKLHGEGYINSTQHEMLKSWVQILAMSEHLSVALTELHQRPITELHTRINHFKFVLDETEAVKTKGYLYYCF